MTIIGNGKRYNENKFGVEKDFEDDIVASSKTLFGKNTIYINAKKKIDSKSLGGTIPDGFFFDFTDLSDPQFYIVEVELSSHSFYNHVFPQVTKFFALFKNTRLQKSLIDKIFSIINTDEVLRSEFRKFLGQVEIYKFLSDILTSSQNILLIVDGKINELSEIMETYTDTWGKMVLYLEIRKYISFNDTIYTITPDFETLQYEDIDSSVDIDEEDVVEKYNESYHLDGVGQNVKDIYQQIKRFASEINSELIFNTQKYYISIKAGKNIAFLKIRNKKVRFIAMMPEERIREFVRNHQVASLSQPVQDFYNGPCASVDITTNSNMDEIRVLLEQTLAYNKSI